MPIAARGACGPACRRRLEHKGITRPPLRTHRYASVEPRHACSRYPPKPCCGDGRSGAITKSFIPPDVSSFALAAKQRAPHVGAGEACSGRTLAPAIHNQASPLPLHLQKRAAARSSRPAGKMQIRDGRQSPHADGFHSNPLRNDRIRKAAGTWRRRTSTRCPATTDGVSGIRGKICPMPEPPSAARYRAIRTPRAASWHNAHRSRTRK